MRTTDNADRPILPPTLRGSGTPEFAQTAWRDIPLMVEAMRQFWMPIRFKPGSYPPWRLPVVGKKVSPYRLL
jgi:hypothetical protein